jgi:hypothetical protein
VNHNKMLSSVRSDSTRLTTLSLSGCRLVDSVALSSTVLTSVRAHIEGLSFLNFERISLSSVHPIHPSLHICPVPREAFIPKPLNPNFCGKTQNQCGRTSHCDGKPLILNPKSCFGRSTYTAACRWAMLACTVSSTPPPQII